jgi:hypothetical protein
MSASWIQVITQVLIVAGALGAYLQKSGRSSGKLETLLEQLAQVVGDHETRIRAVEKPPPSP